jgi:hypothetical protein
MLASLPAEAPLSAATRSVSVLENLVRTLSPPQQAEILAQAEKQGVLYAHQVPAPASQPAASPGSESRRPLLTQLLSGHTHDLEPLQSGPVAFRDTDLDPVQREAVAKALHTPDICLVQGPPGAGKSRVTAEIIVQAAARGERVLFLAPGVAALDRVLEWAAAREVVLPVRCLDRDESLDRLPPATRALTFDEQVRSLTAEALRGARRQLEAAAQHFGRLRRQEAVWTALQELAGSWERLEEERAALRVRGSRLVDEVEQEAAEAATVADAHSFRGKLLTNVRQRGEAWARLDALQGKVRSQIETRRHDLDQLTAQVEALRPLVEAKEHKRWLTKAWWQATFRGNSTSQWLELEAQHQQIQTELEALQAQSASLDQERQQEDAKFQAERTRLLHAEMDRRRTALNGREQILQQELSLLQQKWQNLCQDLSCAGTPPAAITVAAVQTAQAAWRCDLEQREQQQTLARRWVAYLEQDPKALSARLPRYVNVVAATTTALPGDAHFGDAAQEAGPLTFDLLVLEEADQVAEAEFLQAARRARRWVLIGEPTWEDRDMRGDNRDAKNEPPGGATHPVRVPAPGRSTRLDLRSAYFHRLWRHLHCDPRCLPYAWVQENDRLCCRLHAVVPEQRPALESEWVADSPEIELRILTQPRGQPTLAEVVFPPSMAIDRAKQYIFQELQQLAVQASHHSLRWVEEPDRLVLRLANGQIASDVSVLLQPGIRETVGAAPAVKNSASAAVALGVSRSRVWQTCCVEFDRTAGWQRPQAEDWVQQHLGLRDLGRTVRLDTLHRMEDDRLAAFLGDLLCVGSPAASTPAGGPTLPKAVAGRNTTRNDWQAPVEFVSVPALPRAPERSRGRQAERGASPASTAPLSLVLPRKGGAGLELDLADPRQRERLPAEWRPDLPKQGLVNYLEAQAVVRALTALAAELPLVAQTPATPSRISTPPPLCRPRPAVVVLALYAAQAELIRQMIRQAPSLAKAGMEVEVAVPGAFRQREAGLVLVSLTRSHTHRAVAFGEGPRSLALALTRACDKLVIFGDPGTLVRRSLWHGPLDHLDETAAAWERELVAGLVRYLEGHGSHPRAFHLRKGSGS